MAIIVGEADEFSDYSALDPGVEHVRREPLDEQGRTGGVARVALVAHLQALGIDVEDVERAVATEGSLHGRGQPVADPTQAVQGARVANAKPERVATALVEG